MNRFGKYFEIDLQTGQITQITAERFKNTDKPAVYISNSSYSTGESSVIKNCKNLLLTYSINGYVLRRIYNDGRIEEFYDRHGDGLPELIIEAVKYDSIEERQNAKLRLGIETLEKENKRQGEELSKLRGEYYEMKRKFENFIDLVGEVLDQVKDINEKGGAGSRRAVREKIQLVIDKLDFEEIEDDDGWTYKRYFLK